MNMDRDHDESTTSSLPTTILLKKISKSKCIAHGCDKDENSVNVSCGLTVITKVKTTAADAYVYVTHEKSQLQTYSIFSCIKPFINYLQLQQGQQSNQCVLPKRNINLIDLLTLSKCQCQLIYLQKPDSIILLDVDPRSYKHSSWTLKNPGKACKEILATISKSFCVSAKDNSTEFKPKRIFEINSNKAEDKELITHIDRIVYSPNNPVHLLWFNNKISMYEFSTERGVSSETHLKASTGVYDKSGKMKEDKAFEVILKSLLSGGIAGMCAKTAVAPLDRMKILLQAHSTHYSHLGVFSGLKGIVEKERFIALYKGNGAQMVRIFPYAATQFTSFEMYRKLFGEHSHIGRFAAGSAAGVTAVALTYPLDTIRARLAFQVSGEHIYNGIYQCATHIMKFEGGIRALYRGFTPTICGMIPYAGLSFYCFESFKYLCMKYFPGISCKRHSTNTGGLVLLLPYKLLCGGVAGAAAQTVSYPLDVTRRRMQLAMTHESTKKFGMGMVQTLKMIYQENGVSRGLYRGMSINYLRAIPMVAVSFSTYELVKQMLNLDTGLPIKTG